MTAAAFAGLRDRLRNLGRERQAAIDKKLTVDQELGEVLLEVRDSADSDFGPVMTMHDAYELVGVSKPTAYKLLNEADRRRRTGPADDMDQADGLGA